MIIFLGLVLLALSQPKHYRGLRPASAALPPAVRRRLRVAGFAVLCLALGRQIQTQGMALGLVYCLGQITLAALLLSLLMALNLHNKKAYLAAMLLLLVGILMPAISLAQGEAQALLPHRLSPWGMFMSADWVVKVVMMTLALASLLTWTALLAKTLELNKHRRLLRQSLEKITAAHTLAELEKTEGISGTLMDAAVAELHLSSSLIKQQSDKSAIKNGIKERLVSQLSRIEIGYGRRLLSATGLLASIGAVAPFVGLFGTVWGIMNSFIGISEANTTNLAVVAPGIAEALLATALGLVAAIPAVLIYNHFVRKIADIKTTLTDCSAAIMRLVSRDLDSGLSTGLDTGLGAGLGCSDAIEH